MPPQQTASGPWPADAVRDTVAAIAQAAEYERSLGPTLLTRVWQWFSRMADAFFDLFQGSEVGRGVTLVLLAVVVALVVGRLVVVARAAREEAAPGMGRGLRVAGPDPAADAERFASAGLFTEAAHALFAALLAAFAARGDLRLHPSKTAGDYARELQRRGSPAQGGFQAFRRRYEGVIYGVGACSADDYAALLGCARPLL